MSLLFGGLTCQKCFCLLEKVMHSLFAQRQAHYIAALMHCMPPWWVHFRLRRGCFMLLRFTYLHCYWIQSVFWRVSDDKISNNLFFKIIIFFSTGISHLGILVFCARIALSLVTFLWLPTSFHCWFYLLPVLISYSFSYCIISLYQTPWLHEKSRHTQGWPGPVPLFRELSKALPSCHQCVSNICCYYL